MLARLLRLLAKSQQQSSQSQPQSRDRHDVEDLHSHHYRGGARQLLQNSEFQLDIDADGDGEEDDVDDAVNESMPMLRHCITLMKCALQSQV
jgi:hypothetical protein